VQFKKRYFHWSVVGTGVLFLVFVLLMDPAFLAFMPVAVPVVGVISWMNIRMTRFCERCGRTVFRQMPFSDHRYCPGCGSPLEG
jgi:ribosomal protein L37E